MGTAGWNGIGITDPLDFAFGKVTAPAGRESFLVETCGDLTIGVMRRPFADTRDDGGGCPARIGGSWRAWNLDWCERFGLPTDANVDRGLGSS